MATDLIPGDPIKVSSGKSSGEFGIVISTDLKPDSSEEVYQVLLEGAVGRGDLVWFPSWQVKKVSEKSLPETFEGVPRMLREQLSGRLSSEVQRGSKRREEELEEMRWDDD